MIKCNCCGRENSNYAIYCEGCGSLLSTISDSAEVKTDYSDSASYAGSEPEPQAYEPSAEPAPEPSNESPYEPVQAGPVQSGEYNMPPEYTYNPNPAVTSGMEFDSLCIAGFILSITGFMCCGFSSIIGLILCIAGLVRTSHNGKKGRGLAVAGLIMSIFMIIITIIIVASGNGNFHTSYRSGRRG